jgi:hypothetical protein
MASTRDKNTPGNYKLEKLYNLQQSEYSTYVPYSLPVNSYLSGDGLIGARTARETLSNNYIDIETKLFGIGSTNLETPLPEIKPELKQLKSLNIIDRLPVILPEPIVVDKTNRPMYLN